MNIRRVLDAALRGAEGGRRMFAEAHRLIGRRGPERERRGRLIAVVAERRTGADGGDKGNLHKEKKEKKEKEKKE